MKQSAAQLMELARDKSGSRRRELMHRIADLYFEAEVKSNDRVLGMFDEVLGQLASEMESQVRAELAHRIALASVPPRKLIRSFALDESIDVASPILQLSAGLEEEDLLTAVQTRSEAHLRAISRRPNLPASVTGVIVDKAEEETLEVLLANASAELTREAHERLVDRAIGHPALQAAVVRYATLPIDLLNEMYFIVEAALRKVILQRNAQIKPEELDEALRNSRERVSAHRQPLPEDFTRARKRVERAELNGSLDPRGLVTFLRRGDITAYLIALSQLAGVDFEVSRSVHERREVDALAIICKAADFNRISFVTLAVLVLGRENNPMGRAREYGEIYDALPLEVARRTILFWGERRG
ncbi:MAG: DUF2336 domain-containing protein [Phenylobacterium sp.]